MPLFGSSFTRAPIPSGQPGPFVFGRYYRQSLRPVVIGSGIAAALWALLWGISSFQTIHPDATHNLHQLVPFDIALGALYMGVMVIELFGVFGALQRSLAIIRIYAPLAFVALLITTGAEILRIVIHFMFKSALINECITDVQGDIVFTNFGFFGTHDAHNLTQDEAASFCQSAWDHDTFTDIAWLLVAILIGSLFASIVYSYYRQLMDPTSMESRMTNQNVPLQTFGGPAPYAQGPYTQGPYGPGGHAYGQSIDGLNYGAPPYDNAKLPEYGYTGAGERDIPGEKEPEEIQGGSRA